MDFQKERWKEGRKGGMLSGGEREERNKRELRFLVLAVFLRQKMLEQQSRCPGTACTEENIGCVWLLFTSTPFGMLFTKNVFFRQVL